MKTLEHWSRHADQSKSSPWRKADEPHCIWAWCGGRHIKTSIVESQEGDVVSTRSGSRYRLGKPDPNYRHYFEDSRPGSRLDRFLTALSGDDIDVNELFEEFHPGVDARARVHIIAQRSAERYRERGEQVPEHVLAAIEGTPPPVTEAPSPPLPTDCPGCGKDFDECDCKSEKQFVIIGFNPWIDDHPRVSVRKAHSMEAAVADQFKEFPNSGLCGVVEKEAWDLLVAEGTKPE